MATVDPVSSMSGIVQIVTWTGITTTTDTPTAYGPLNRGPGALRAAITFSGTFAGGTVTTLLGSVDGVVYATVTDRNGNAVSATAAKMQEFTSSALYFKPSVASGAADNADVSIAFRV